MSEHSSEPKSLGLNVKVQLHLSNYEIKADLKNATELMHQLLLKKLIEQV